MMTKYNKLKILKITLRIFAVFMAGWWGLSHLFFPKWFFSLMGIELINSGMAIVAVHTCGILVLGIAAASWLAASDPVKNKVVLQMIYIIGIGSILVFSYHLLFRDYSARVWLNVVFIASLLILVTILYPRKGAS